MHDFSAEQTVGVYEADDFTTNVNAVDQIVFNALQRTDQAGTPEDDPDGEWLITHVQATLTIAGSVKLVAVTPAGLSLDLTVAHAVGANDEINFDCHVYAGAKNDVGYTSTGGGSSTCKLTGRAVRRGHSKPNGPEVP